MPKTNRPYITKRSSELAELRVNARLTRAEAADQLEISVAGLGNIERGVRASDHLLERMARLYGVGPRTVRRAYVATRREFIMREKP